MYAARARIAKYQEHNYFTVQTITNGWWRGLGDEFVSLREAMSSLKVKHGQIVMKVSAEKSENGFTYWYVSE